MMRVKTAFTLAEVLVTLMIIGVIAAMTIPGLRKNADMQEYVAGCKKAYSTISGAMRAAEMQHGDFKRWAFKDGDNASIQKAFDYIAKEQMSLLRQCGIDKDGCWKQTRNLGSGNFAYTSKTYGLGINTISFTTADGMNWNIDGLSGTDHGVDTGATIGFFVDINGDKKPNMLGYDVFTFIYDPERGIVPAGSDNQSKECSSAGNGVDCAAKVIKEGKITY